MMPWKEVQVKMLSLSLMVFYVTCKDILVICVTAQMCKLYLRSGSQRHRHFAGFFNVTLLHRHFLYGHSDTPPFSRLLRHARGTENVFLTWTPGVLTGVNMLKYHSIFLVLRPICHAEYGYIYFSYTVNGHDRIDWIVSSFWLTYHISILDIGEKTLVCYRHQPLFQQPPLYQEQNRLSHLTPSNNHRYIRNRTDFDMWHQATISEVPMIQRKHNINWWWSTVIYDGS